MKEELKQLIQQHLPSLAAGEMAKYIELAEVDKKNLAVVTANRDTLSIEAEALKTENIQLKQKTSEVQLQKLELDKKEKELREVEFKLELLKLKYQLEAEQKSKSDIYNLVNTFVRNPRAIEVMNYSANESQSSYYSGSNYVTPPPIFRAESKTTEKLETKD